MATVATSGDYDDLLNKPTIPAAHVQSNWSESDINDPSYIQNKPTIPAAQVQSDWDEANSAAVSYIQNKPTIPAVIDSVQSTSTTDALSANQGKELQDQIDNLQSR